MEEEPLPSPEIDLAGRIFARTLTVFGAVGSLAALVTFYALLPSTLSSTAEIASFNLYSYFLLNLTYSATAIYMILTVSAIVVTISMATLFVGRNNLSVGFRTTNRVQFFRYLSIFIMIELVLSVISPLVSSSFANDPVLQLSLPAQNFVFMASTISQTVIVQLIPISVIAIVTLAIRKKLTLKSFLNPDSSLKGVELPIVVISAVIAAVMTSVDLGSGMLNFVSFFVMDYIFIKFGFLRSVVAGFTVSEFNVILQLGQIPYLPFIMYGFLVIWSIIGIYSFITLFTRATQARARSVQETGQDVKIKSEEVVIPQVPMSRVEREMRNPANFWIRSACPSCGNFNFHLKDDLSLECKNCHQVIGREAIGEFNIKLIRSRGFQN